VGCFDLNAQGQWCAWVNAEYREELGGHSRRLGAFADRLDAITTLWGARHAAHCRHPADCVPNFVPYADETTRASPGALR
jgi:hypothetical protein